MIKAILFVDDESFILQGLKRMLRSLRNEMDFFFAESGEEALNILSEQQISVIVSDMRMPGMDGATLLYTVLEEYPQIIRIMLTGHADDQSILKTIPVVHQFLVKPSDPQTLKEVLTRACALQEIVGSDKLRTLVAGLGGLPSLPGVYAELQEKLIDPEVDISEVAAVIEKDLAMSTKVLQLVNSAFFGLYSSVDSPARAVNLLGLDTVKALVLGVGIFTELVPAEDSRFSVSELWEHSFTVANFAKIIANMEEADKTTVDNCFIGGIVHDIGKLLLYSSMGEEYLSILEKVETDTLAMHSAESLLYDADHGDIGGYLLGVWGLPGPVVEATTFHHKLDKYPEESFCPALAVHGANVIYYSLYPKRCIGKAPEVETTFIQQAGLEDRFDRWQQACKDSVAQEETDD